MNGELAEDSPTDLDLSRLQVRCMDHVTTCRRRRGGSAGCEDIIGRLVGELKTGGVGI